MTDEDIEDLQAREAAKNMESYSDFARTCFRMSEVADRLARIERIRAFRWSRLAMRITEQEDE